MCRIQIMHVIIFKKKLHKNKRAFTIMEIVIVVILIGIIAAFALPNYNKSIRKSHERDAVLQLQALHAANLIFRARNGDYFDTVGTGELLPVIPNLFLLPGLGGKPMTFFGRLVPPLTGIDPLVLLSGLDAGPFDSLASKPFP